MHHPERSLRLRGYALTDTGRVRDNNEDSVHLWLRDDRFILAVVADGMGGAVAGEEASSIAVETIENGLKVLATEDAEHYTLMEQDALIEQMKEAIYRANLNIVEKAVANPELKGMGTTLTMSVIRGSHITIGHVGDSRAYLVSGNDGHIMQITTDHSFVQALVAAGHITEAEAEEHPMRNVLYRALGQARDIEVDVYYEFLRAGDRLVLCSDGLTLHVKPDEIAELALSNEDPEVCSQALVDLANSRGGRDNVSVVIIKAESTGETTLKNHTITEEFELDGDTLILRDEIGFGSSESSSNIQQEPDDSTSQKLNTSVSHHVVSPNQRTGEHRILGEGKDNSTPDQ